jgi:predicted Rossmann fold flavoprotein
MEAPVVVVGAGAAGLATAIFAARRLGPGQVVLLDTARRPGAKILVSGGGRCNVTNREVTERDFSGGPSHLVRRVLRAFTAADAATFFRGMGVALHEEEDGKLFPDTHRARTVLDSLLVEAARRGVELRSGVRVDGIERDAEGRDQGDFVLQAGGAVFRARRVVLATGGLSLPKTGSDGGGYALVRRLGHSLVPTTPALVPLVLEGHGHEALSGVSHPVELRLRGGSSRAASIRGAMLWTHFGVSGPAALDVSRHLLRSRLEGEDRRLVANLLPGEDAAGLARRLVEEARQHPRAALRRVFEGRLPASVLEAVAAEVDAALSLPIGQLPRERRQRLVSALTERELAVRDSRGYNFAEVTAGGVPLAEVDLRTMESRKCPGLHLVGEILDVDGRLGGFNFQWAWSSGFVAGAAIAAAHAAAIMRPSEDARSDPS